MFLLRYVCVEASGESLWADARESLLEAMAEDGKKEESQKTPAGQEVRECWEAWILRMKDAGITARIPGIVRGKEDLAAQEENALWITDDPRRARELAAQGKAVMGLLCGKESGQDFEGISHVGYRLTEMEPEYFERVWRRQAGIPWEILETQRCLVRETTIEDAEALYEIYEQPGITDYLEELPKDRYAFCAWLKEYQKQVYGLLGYGIWTVCLKEEASGSGKAGGLTVIGRAGLNVREGFAQPELGFVIGKPWQGLGLAYEVCSAILRFARELEIPEVIAFADQENEASKGLLRRLGVEENKEAERNGSWTWQER